MHVRGHLVAAKSARKAFRWLAKQDFMGGWMPEGAEFHEGFLGEYPWGGPFKLYPDEHSSRGFGGEKSPARLTPVCNTVSSSHSEDASQKEGVTIHVPARLFFRDVRAAPMSGPIGEARQRPRLPARGHWAARVALLGSTSTCSTTPSSAPSLLRGLRPMSHLGDVTPRLAIVDVADGLRVDAEAEPDHPRRYALIE